ncbi:arginine/lysine/ornithine decarboxylase [Bacillus mesophilus]|uniref:Aminotransferase class I/II-fold pyridoxal phosphate-dependent enzyme n=1 Tax=Bacillus mesophilus TaxID=1808955 RepID=A0A6M0QCR1_9BACI|nr:aminotransferase class I/II-fold pyridoxal phosphate-dependent enzyme [Bacillus mesophilus]MBM7663398.1 arginine/lysine/ornithine decarboxylase [Bacillus mesophilus]NEY74152.1 aminotransferase class I/II-fold pyridoxal phosphate-dependent enzyme [Bacillus mesophilus]
MNQSQTPLMDALINHIDKKPISLHVPGHKNGQVFLDKGHSYFREILSLDVTELTGLDDLHHPEEAIKISEDLLANLYGAEKSFFLVNGTTVGNLAMILSTCSSNDKVLVQRNCHKSVMNALILAGAKPVFLAPKYDEEAHVQTYVPTHTVIEAVEDHSDAKAIILTNPTYYGHTHDLKDIVRHAHIKGIPVLVDEAHGAHFGIGAPFPESAIHSGADLVVQSAHKTLPAMTMGSYLHYQSQLVSIDKVTFYLRALQSSSPSYPIMASLDLARAFLANLKVTGIGHIYKNIHKFKEGLNNIPQICTVQSNDQGLKQDPLKILIQSRCQLTGYELQAIFEEVGLFTELADFYNVLCIMPLAEVNMDLLLSKIREALYKIQSIPEQKRLKTRYQVQSMVPYSFDELKSKRTLTVHLEESINHVSAQTLTPYPPGIPLILQGELITDEHIKELQALIKQRAKIQGLVNDTIYIYESLKEEN